jgi:hypothetical protein
MDALSFKQLLIHKETIEKDVDALFLHVVLLIILARFAFPAGIDPNEHLSRAGA